MSWLVLGKGVPVVARDGEEVGKVSAVVGDRARDIFSGIAYRPGLLESDVFAPASAIDHLEEGAVRLNIDSHEAAKLDTYDG